MTSNISILNILLESGADPFLQDKNGLSPIKLAHQKMLYFENYVETDELTEKLELN